MITRYYSSIALIALLGVGGCSTDVVHHEKEEIIEQSIDENNVIVPGIIRIRFKNESVVDRLVQLKATANVTRTGEQTIDDILSQYGVKSIAPVFIISKRFEKRQKEAGLHLWYEVEFDEKSKTKSMINDMSLSDFVDVAEPVLQKRLIGNPIAIGDYGVLTKAAANDFNDPYLSKQWHYDNAVNGDYSAAIPEANISLFRAWKENTGTPNVIVAINDSGVDITHEDLKANLWVNKAEVAGNGIDDDQNGYIDDIHGYNFLKNIPEIKAADHGTHVAGTVAATNNNGIGVCGIAGGDGSGNGVRIMACQILDGLTTEIWRGVERAMVYAADNGAVISQNSWGYNAANYTEKAVEDAINYFIKHAGCDENGNQTGPMKGGVVIFASGNERSEQNYYPAAYANVIAVTATSHKNTSPYYANIGRYVDIAAPGGDGTRGYDVYSTVTNNSYGYMNGTSMACPHVSGVAALIVSKYGRNGYTCDMLTDKLLAASDDLQTWEPKKYYLMGKGLLNASKALDVEDYNAPEAITDLTLVHGKEGVRLKWSKAKDIEDGQAVKYLIYMDYYELDNQFLPATAIKEIKADGSEEQFTSLFEELDMSKKMWFGIVAVDLAGNRSVLSNQVAYSPILDFEIQFSTYKVKKELELAWGNGYKGTMSLKVISTSGRTVYTKEFDSKLQTIKVDLSFLSAGNYQIVIGDNTQQVTKTIVKL
ncbi:MAG: S8 family serine peptidase [Marinifilaceae bacterium]